MKHSKRSYFVLLAVLVCILAIGACKKKQAAPPPPPPPPPPQPTANISANPSTIQAGQASTLTWRTTDATDVNIDGLGKVDASGSQSVSPQASTTYRLTARGAGGSAEASARVTVSAAPPPPPPQQVSQSLEDMFNQNVHDIYFDYDKYDVRPDQQATVQQAAAFLKQHPEIKVQIEGHCDERGSTEYNLALGDNRARAAQNALAAMGIPAANASVISFGKEKPQCTEHTEDCWQRNRRAHFVIQKSQ